MFRRFTRILALAFTAAALPTSAAVAMPADPAVQAPATGFTGSATTTGSAVQVTHRNRGDVAGSDAAQRQATTAVASSDRSDAAQASRYDRIVLRGRPLVPPSHVGIAPSRVSTAAGDSSDGFDWVLAGSLLALAVAGGAVALRPRRVAV